MIYKKYKAGTFNTKIIYVLAFIIFIAGLLLLAVFSYSYFSKKANVNNLTEIELKGDNTLIEKKCEFIRLLDGVCVDSQEEVNPELVAVMIENHVDARPQSGLAKASVVYEAPVEANYSRFMAIFPKDVDISKVGPVRSARPYYLDWLREYGKDILYMHVGGSPDALSIISKDIRIFDFNEFSKGPYFWRSTDRYAPHNVYTSSENWQKAWNKFGTKENTDFKSWNFRNIDNCVDTGEECITEISIDFLPPSYSTTWKYNTSTRKYARYQIEGRHLDQNGTAIEADTIIIQKVHSEVLDNVGRLKIDTIGSGEAIIFQNGHKEEGEWRKDSVTGRTEWFNFDGPDGQPMELKPGKIWVEVVNERGEVDWK
ncbi:MAG: hypothetical protein A2493_02740 [Candidatus Magasanikbacteria bacterium RIFOXYC12_FULL_33_11]|uniref:DUF3048 domain-containing protein n=1 Tax=Candidatus Magasanikbacteria bacterium RIFOXYC12_FULL_33_11 TaxID=1798701 RepID=A0A1F6NM63_9BACT|nr:MAG: hypothetical protein A2493_02740 [Candidatus Magasanikbacteria bacterium RIFOXYC12_FULL_33_11]